MAELRGTLLVNPGETDTVKVNYFTRPDYFAKIRQDV